MPARWLVAAVLGGLLAGCHGGATVEEPFTSARTQEEAASARSPIVGRPAPDFTLEDQDGEPVSLRDLRGQWLILYFYPKDDTPGCTCEATEFTRLLGQFRRMGARVYGISADPPATHRIFIKQYDLGVDLLSDPDHEVMRRYGAWVDASLGDESYGRVIRTSLIVDPDGIIRYHWPEVIPTGHAERAREKLAWLQARAN